MSLDKAIASGKEQRKPYRKSKAFDPHCRNHNQCSYCRDNRTVQTQKALGTAQDALTDFFNSRDKDGDE
jgi:hypothetical protein